MLWLIKVTDAQNSLFRVIGREGKSSLWWRNMAASSRHRGWRRKLSDPSPTARVKQRQVLLHTFKACLEWHNSSKAVTPKPSHTVPSNGDQRFRCYSLQEIVLIQTTTDVYGETFIWTLVSLYEFIGTLKSVYWYSYHIARYYYITLFLFMLFSMFLFSMCKYKYYKF